MTVRRLRTSWPAILIAGAVLIAGCHATPPEGRTLPLLVSPAPSPVSPSATRSRPPPAAPTDESADNAIDQVIAISIDGLNPRAISELGKSRTPAFHRLMREGAYTLNARTVREQTATLPNHTAMLTGRRVDDEAWRTWICRQPRQRHTVHRAAGHYVASVFDVVHDHGHSTALFASKTKFKLYERTWNTHGGPDRVGRNDGRAKIDRLTIDRNNTRLVAELIAELRRKPREFTFVHLSLPDRVGHRHEFMGNEYLDAVQIHRSPARPNPEYGGCPARLRRHTLLILTADHGGRGAAHYGASKLQNYRIPFMAWGPGIAAGRDLYDVNPDFRTLVSAAPAIAESSPSVMPTSRTWRPMHWICPGCPALNSTARATLDLFRYSRSARKIDERAEPISADGVDIPRSIIGRKGAQDLDHGLGLQPVMVRPAVGLDPGVSIAVLTQGTDALHARDGPIDGDGNVFEGQRRDRMTEIRSAPHARNLPRRFCRIVARRTAR